MVALNGHVENSTFVAVPIALLLALDDTIAGDGTMSMM